MHLTRQFHSHFWVFMCVVTLCVVDSTLCGHKLCLEVEEIEFDAFERRRCNRSDVKRSN